MIRRSPLRSGAPPKRKSWLARSTEPIPQVNPKAKAKRKIGYRKMLRSKEYLAAKAEAMERAGNRCEWNDVDTHTGFSPRRDAFRNVTPRCEMTTELDAHHLRYPKSRPIAVTDLVILCNWHHRQAESQKPHKWGKRGF